MYTAGHPTGRFGDLPVLDLLHQVGSREKQVDIEEFADRNMRRPPSCVDISYPSMRIFWSGLAITALAATAGAQASHTDPFKEYNITAPDGSITAKFIGSGASLSELWVRDKFGGFRDVVLGYDDTTLWQTDPSHPVFNSIVGRYANRIKNGTFSIPISQNPDPNSPNTYHIFRNGPDSAYTLHGGAIGWDRRNWTLVSSTSSSLTFQHFDPADENFPGNVSAKVTYMLSAGGKYDAVVTATATEKTPIMLTAHVY
ncbi:unnamed protein product [Rhizoctonia solani]|uniref:Aldose 1-epimerase n=1 Tax=Rhizoctonia solani TaxID=456999 RepID=A0A8H3CF93_9AGAM|nr:unnamed protein product [Rhizoctonia solani]